MKNFSYVVLEQKEVRDDAAVSGEERSVDYELHKDCAVAFTI